MNKDQSIGVIMLVASVVGIHLTDADSEQQEDSVEVGPKTRS